MKELVRSDPVGDKENIIVMDSDNMEEGWKDQIEKVNPNSGYDWDRVSDDMRDIENEYHKDDDNEEEMGNQESVNLEPAERNLPKRVLAYSSLKLLRQLSRNLKYFLNQVHYQIFLQNFFFHTAQSIGSYSISIASSSSVSFSCDGSFIFCSSTSFVSSIG